jgi:hypothetical protein
MCVLTSLRQDRVLEGWVDEQPLDLSPNACDIITMDNVGEFSRPWRLKIHGVQGIPERFLNSSDDAVEMAHRSYFFLRISMFHGEGPLMAPQHTKPVEASVNLRWDQWVFAPPINQIPRG